MKMAFIVPGVGDTFYCQNCVRNLDLVSELKKQGHDPILVPMYLPLSVEVPPDMEAPLFFSALNMYLREKFRFFEKIPDSIKRCFASKKLLMNLSKRSGSTDPRGLEEMTISMMKGEGGKHDKELLRMIDWLRNEVRPDAVYLSNALLLGVGTKIKKELGVPLFVTLQDEDQWINKMRQPFASKAWAILKEHSLHVDMFMPVSAYYRDLVIERSGISESKMEVVPIGISSAKYRSHQPLTDPLTIGFLSRMCASSGLDALVDAFLILKKDPEFKRLRLKVRGGMAPQDKKFIESIKKKVRLAGYDEDVDMNRDFSEQEVENFFGSITALSVPAPEGEAFGLFLIESMASGIPVVQPDKGAYAEIVNATGGGMIYRENTPEGLAECLGTLLSDKERIKNISEAGRASVTSEYTIEKMANKIVGLARRFINEDPE